jgi:hypothetical protein
MKKNLFFILFLVFTGSLFAQEINLPELSGYKKVTNYPVFTPDNLWDFINGAADNYLAYGFVDLHVAEYKKGKNVIKLEVYQHKNDIMAFGIYSSERSPSFRFINLGAQGYSADGSINFFKSRYYVKIKTYSKSEKTLQAAESLASQVANMLTGENKMPSALNQFPDEGRKKNEETYINESVLGHKYLDNAFRANYEAGNSAFSVYLFQKPDHKAVITAVNELLKGASMDQTDEDSGKYAIKDGYNGNVFLAWKDNTMVIISGLEKDQSDIADRYTSELLK